MLIDSIQDPEIRPLPLCFDATEATGIHLRQRSHLALPHSNQRTLPFMNISKREMAIRS